MNNIFKPRVIQKTPNDDFDQEIDWSQPSSVLGGDIIESSTWSVDGPDNSLTATDDFIGIPANTTTAWLSGGTIGAFYNVTNTIVTAGGREFDRSFIINVLKYVYIN